MNLALFDLDHTLLPLDSDHAWGHFTETLGWREAGAFSTAADRFYEQYKAGTLDIVEYVRFVTEPLRERDAATNAAAHARFMAEVIQPAIRPAALDLIAQHREAGDTLLIVTATNAFVTAPIAQALGVPHLIALDLVMDERGLPTGEIAGTPSFREGKITRVEQWLHARGLQWTDLSRTSFYSDSINDLPLLERVSHPVATNPDARLQAIATQRAWPILNLFT
jgi:HAD superfamily hydrolase (TIGR01490 family)